MHGGPGSGCNSGLPCADLLGAAVVGDAGPDVALLVVILAGGVQQRRSQHESHLVAVVGVGLAEVGEDVAAVGVEEKVRDVHAGGATEGVGLGLVDGGRPAVDRVAGEQAAKSSFAERRRGLSALAWARAPADPPEGGLSGEPPQADPVCLFSCGEQWRQLGDPQVFGGPPVLAPHSHPAPGGLGVRSAHL